MTTDDPPVLRWTPEDWDTVAKRAVHPYMNTCIPAAGIPGLETAPEPMEERSSCTGDSCDNPLKTDKSNKQEVVLDSLEDLAGVIDEEIIHNTP